MPVLDDRNVTRLYLPSTQDLEEANRAYVDIVTEPTAGDMLGMISDNASETNAQRIITVLAGLIQGWNFTDKNGAPVEVSADNLRKFKLADFQYLSEYVTKNLNIGGDESPKVSAVAET